MDTKIRSPLALSHQAMRQRLMVAASALQNVDRVGAIGRHSEPVDYAQAVHERSKSLALQLAISETQDEISRALDRMAMGLYGMCEECSARIPSDRLSVLPETTRCLDCQRAAELRLGRCA